MGVRVKPLDDSKRQGWTDDKGKFCLPLSDGYYIKFPEKSGGLFAVWFFRQCIGCDLLWSGATKRANAHHAARIMAAIEVAATTPQPTAQEAQP